MRTEPGEERGSSADMKPRGGAATSAQMKCGPSHPFPEAYTALDGPGRHLSHLRWQMSDHSCSWPWMRQDKDLLVHASIAMSSGESCWRMWNIMSSFMLRNGSISKEVVRVTLMGGLRNKGETFASKSLI